jgi:hypothetical protein
MKTESQYGCEWKNEPANITWDYIEGRLYITLSDGTKLVATEFYQEMGDNND